MVTLPTGSRCNKHTVWSPLRQISRPDDGPVEGPKHVVLVINTTPHIVSCVSTVYTVPSFIAFKHFAYLSCFCQLSPVKLTDTCAKYFGGNCQHEVLWKLSAWSAMETVSKKCYENCQHEVLWRLSARSAMETVSMKCYGNCQHEVLWKLSAWSAMETVSMKCYGNCQHEVLWKLSAW